MISFPFFVLFALTTSTRAYFLIGPSVLTVQRADPIMSPGAVASHVHLVFGGSNFGVEIPSSEYLRQSECTSTHIAEDKSAYWFPQLYFERADGSFDHVGGGPVIYYLYDPPDPPDPAGKPGKPGATSFPDNFRMITGSASEEPEMGSREQRAVSFLCLDFNGKTDPPYDSLPKKLCPSGIRAQINFQSCWNGRDPDSSNHKSHVDYPTEGPDKGPCPAEFPIRLPRIFSEVYYGTQYFDDKRHLAKNPNQPFVFANGDATGHRYHGDFIMGWDPKVLQRVINECNCNNFGDPQCCADKGLMTLQPKQTCTLSPQIDEPVLGNLPKLPGNNPVRLGGEVPPETNPPNFLCNVTVNAGQQTKRDDHPFSARDHLRFAKRYNGAGL